MIRPAYHLTISTQPSDEPGVVALKGNDIRSKPEEIARYCLVQHRAINEDVATIAESIALADRIFPRHRGATWARLISIQIPVFEIETFRRADVIAALTESIHFLTGDTWVISFTERMGKPLGEDMLPFEKVAFQYVTPYSDGLDSFAQAQLLEKEVGRNKILKMRSARIGQDSDDLQRPVLRVPRSLGSMPKPEQTYRTRPFVFFSFAGIGAFVANSEAVVIGESGQGALGPALVRYADEWPFRSTHPGFISRLEKYLSLAFHTPIHFRMPQLWRTKGEVLLSLKDDGLLGNWTGTSSCSVRPANRHGGRACGICGGCMLRALATHSAGVTDPSYNPAFDPTQIRAVASDRMAMSTSERHMVVRSMGSMAEFAKLDRDDSKSVIQSESMLFMNPKPTQVQIKLRDLIARHAKEWANYLENLPAGGWAHKFAEQL